MDHAFRVNLIDPTFNIDDPKVCHSAGMAYKLVHNYELAFDLGPRSSELNEDLIENSEEQILIKYQNNNFKITIDKVPAFSKVDM